MRDSTSEYQQTVLKNRVITETEYRGPVDATRGYLPNEGFGVWPPTEQNGNELGVQSSYDGENGPSDQNMQARNDEYTTQVGSICVSQSTPLTR